MIKSLPFRLKLAKQRGEQVAIEHGQTALHVDPFAIAKAHDILIEAKPEASGGVSGMLLRHGDNFGIIYATHISNEGFQRFSIAHELGHYFLDGHVDQILADTGAHVSKAGFTSSDPIEMEADSFASGLLMPAKLFRKAMTETATGMTAIEKLSTECKTSLTATAIRYAELCSDAVAVVVSSNDQVDLCVLSEAMKSLPGLDWLRKGTPLPSGTLASSFWQEPKRIAAADKDTDEVAISAWLGGTKSVPAIEETVGLGGYDKVLTVLSCPDLIDDRFEDQYDDEEELVDSWTPRFKK